MSQPLDHRMPGTMCNVTSFPCYVVLLLLACCLTARSQVQVGFSPRVLRSPDDESCVTESQRNAVRSRVKNQLQGILKESIAPKLCQSGVYENIPTASCADIHRDCPSGNYWLSGDNAEPIRTYCTSNDNRCCHGNDRKWMRIGYLNMSEPEASCPNGWRTINQPVRSCRRYTDSYVNSVTYSSNGIAYSRVCGRIVAYQYGTPEAFSHYTQSPTSYTLDSRYVDGISVTYGSPRQHIWTLGQSLIIMQQTVPAAIQPLRPLFKYRRLSTTTTFAKWAPTPLVDLALYNSWTGTHSGTAKVALVPAAAVSSTNHHGSVGS